MLLISKCSSEVDWLLSFNCNWWHCFDCKCSTASN